jgi:hypothetical protein
VAQRLTAELVRAWFDYEPDAGVLRWKRRTDVHPRWNGKYPGTVAGSLSRQGYQVIKIKRGPYKGHHSVHRVAWLWMTGEHPTHEIDHRDTDRSNNAWSNIRNATKSQNQANRKMNKLNKSGFKGVCRHAPNRWRAQIMYGGKVYNLGSFPTPETAHAAYVAAAEKERGEFARAA